MTNIDSKAGRDAGRSTLDGDRRVDSRPRALRTGRTLAVISVFVSGCWLDLGADSPLRLAGVELGMPRHEVDELHPQSGGRYASERRLVVDLDPTDEERSFGHFPGIEGVATKQLTVEFDSDDLVSDVRLELVYPPGSTVWDVVSIEAWAVREHGAWDKRQASCWTNSTTFRWERVRRVAVLDVHIKTGSRGFGSIECHLHADEE